MNKKLFALPAIVCAISLSFPLSALAATTSQIINQAFINFLNSANTNLSGEASLHFSEKPLGKAPENMSGDIHMTLAERAIADQNSSEGRLVFDKIVIYEDGEISEPTLTPEDPLAIQWKEAGGEAYVRLEKIPAEIVTELQAMEIDVSRYIGKWISLDLTEILGSLPVVPQADNSSSMLKGLSKDIANLSSTPFFRLIRVEKKSTDSAGHTVLRARVRVNPSFIYKLQQLAWKGIKIGTPGRSEQIKKINTAFASLRKILNQTDLVLVVDQTTGDLTRIEIGGRSVKPQKSCSYNKYDKLICKTKSYLTIKYLAGISIFQSPGPAIEAPTESVGLKEVMEKLIPKEEPLQDVAPSSTEY